MVKPITQYQDVMINAPFGAVCINIQNDCVTGVTLFPAKQTTSDVDGLCAQHVKQQIAQYFQNADVKINVSYKFSGTPFQQRVWKAISAIPVGQVLTYSELAEKVGSGPRAVANACGANKLPLLIPCHRVVAKNGLGGFMQSVPNGLKIKEWLLAHESK
jgi:methylated-DNA-[protein]-cysteine S-methyltransferase